MVRYGFITAVFIATATALAGCSDSSQPPPKVVESTPIDPTTVGRIAARVRYSGDVPPPKVIVMSSTPQCALAHEGPVYDQSLLVSDGRLQNAIVYIEKGLEQFDFAAPATPIAVDQKGCLYAPRVSLAMVGQPVDFLNSDAEAHNVHGFPNVVSAWNFMLSRKGAKRTLTFDRPEMAIRIGCDIHPWMRGYLGITTHPFAAVTASDGGVTLDGVPPGNYTVTVWHETLGTQSKQVGLSAKGSVEIEFVYAGE